MTVHRFYLGEDLLAGLGEEAEVQLSAEAAHRIAHVLRLRAGERVRLFAGGREFDAELTRVAGSVRARLVAEAPGEPSRTPLTLYQAVIRPNRFEWLLEKATELGVTRFAPIVTARSVHQAASIGGARFERWQRIAIEAAEQCGRRTAPVLAKPVPYQTALSAAPGVRVFAWESLRSAGGGDALPKAGDADGFSLFVGPEGGWDDAEIQQARSARTIFLGLGPNTLRAETAAVAAIALLLLAPGSHSGEM